MWMQACRYGMASRVIRVILRMDSRGGALAILIRWVPRLEFEAISGTCMRVWAGGASGHSGHSSPGPGQRTNLAYKANKASQLCVLVCLAQSLQRPRRVGGVDGCDPASGAPAQRLNALGVTQVTSVAHSKRRDWRRAHGPERESLARLDGRGGRMRSAHGSSGLVSLYVEA